MRMRRSFVSMVLALVASGGVDVASALPPSPPVGRLSILAIEGAFGWSLEVELEGSEVVSTVALLPAGSESPLAVPCESTGPSATRCTFVGPSFPDPPYPSLPALLAAYPAGDWTLTVNGTLSAVVPFAPFEPNGTPAVLSPPNGAVRVSSTPSVSYQHGCSNCIAAFVEITDLGGPLSIEATVFGDPIGSPPPSPDEVAWEDLVSLDGPKPDELPAVQYRLEIGVITGALTIETLAPGTASESTFQYGAGAERTSSSGFSVPEPGASWIAGIGALLAIARRRG